jgi:tRNA threonylcarbamoyladenosine biosynthesis protein TsaE
MISIKINNLSEIGTAANEFIRQLASFTNSNCIAFHGSMGAGKTTFIKALCKCLDVVDIVNSPSFAIINEYYTKDKKKVFHFDFYRINTVSEVYDFGYEEYFYSGNLCFIEWPEKIESILPEDHLKVNIKEIENGARLVEIG